MTVPCEEEKTQMGAERDALIAAGFKRHISARCPNIGRHKIDPERFPGCPCHPTIPQPCPDCYAIESYSRQVPWSELGIEPQAGSAALSQSHETPKGTQ